MASVREHKRDGVAYQHYRYRQLDEEEVWSILASFWTSPSLPSVVDVVDYTDVVKCTRRRTLFVRTLGTVPVSVITCTLNQLYLLAYARPAITIGNMQIIVTFWYWAVRSTSSKQQFISPCAQVTKAEPMLRMVCWISEPCASGNVHTAFHFAMEYRLGTCAAPTTTNACT